MKRIQLTPLTMASPPTPITSTTTVRTTDGRVLQATVADFKGTPQNPLGREELREKFLMLTRQSDQKQMSDVFSRLQSIEDEKSLDWLSI